jgi:hypothetical protein
MEFFVFFRLSVLKDNVVLTPVDCSVRHLTPTGIAAKVRPHRSDSDEEAHLTPRGKQVPGAEINSEV